MIGIGTHWTLFWFKYRDKSPAVRFLILDFVGSQRQNNRQLSVELDKITSDERVCIYSNTLSFCGGINWASDPKKKKNPERFNNQSFHAVKAANPIWILELILTRPDLLIHKMDSLNWFTFILILYHVLHLLALGKV